MNVLVTGGRGQLGRALVRCSPPDVALHPLGRAELDVIQPVSIARALDMLAPDVVINAAAFTNVDRAEYERAQAAATNAAGAREVAQACAQRRIRLIHISTDYVFDGCSRRPYREDDPVAPLNVYGETKATGEQAVRELGGIVVRTAWLYGEGGPSFVHAIARRALEVRALQVVDGQLGSPTWADHLAEALLMLARLAAPPELLHVVGNEPISRVAFAQVIIDEVRRIRPITCERIEPVPATVFPAPAPRPTYAVLDTTRARTLGVPIGAWRDGVRRVVERDIGARS